MRNFEVITSELARTVSLDVKKGMQDLLKDDLMEIILYGSYARGDFDAESDIDIMVVIAGEIGKVYQYKDQVSQFSSRLSLENDIEVSLLLRNMESVKKGLRVLPFYKNIMDEGVMIYG